MTETVGTSTHPIADAELDLEIGQKVGEYEIQKKIGQGGFGAVFKATHPLIGKDVAIKVLSRKFSSDPEMVSRFIAEARAVNQIRNRHIIDIFGFGQLADGRAYYVMEYLEGEPLDALTDRGRVGLPTALPILTSLAKALDAAHAKGIAHRDLKAENVFLMRDPDGGMFPKLLDFGIAKLLGSDETLKHKTRTGAPIGTPYYRSPEQCRGRDVDQRTDIYAFGVLCYLMLTGSYPHDGDDYMDILMKQIQEDPALPSQVADDLPAGIDDAIMWMMAKDPGGASAESDDRGARARRRGAGGGHHGDDRPAQRGVRRAIESAGVASLHDAAAGEPAALRDAAAREHESRELAAADRRRRRRGCGRGGGDGVDDAAGGGDAGRA